MTARPGSGRAASAQDGGSGCPSGRPSARPASGGGRAAGVGAALAALVAGLAGGGAAARLRCAPATRFGLPRRFSAPTHFGALTHFSAPSRFGALARLSPLTRFIALTPFSAPVAALVLALAAFASAPAAAQVTISASGNCGGTPANCGANGDRDTAWPGLQVDEGDIVTFASTVSPAVTSGSLVVIWQVSGSARNTDDLRFPSGGTIPSNHQLIAGAVDDTHISFFQAAGAEVARVLIYDDGVAEADETLTLASPDIQSNNAGNYVAGTPSSATVTIRGTDSAPDFGTGSVSAKSYTYGTAITEFQVPAATGGNGGVSYTASGLPAGLVFDADGSGSCPGTEPREICGTPTGGGSGTVTITAADADSNTASSDEDTLTFTVTVAGTTLASAPSPLTEGNLNGATLTVTLPSGVGFVGGVNPSSFALVATPAIPGLSISGGGFSTRLRQGVASATLTLATGAGYGFSRPSTLAVRVSAAATTASGALTSAALAVSPTPGVTLSRRSLALQEAPGTNNANRGTYTLVLDSPLTGCSGSVNVVPSSNNPDVTVSPSWRTFRNSGGAQSWNSPQTFTVTAAQDTDNAHDAATISHSIDATLNCPGAGYTTSLTLPSLSVSVHDDEAPSASISATNPATLTEANLNNATVTVALANGATFGSGVTTASFELVTDIAGVSVDSVSSVSSGDASAVLTLAFSGNFTGVETLAVKVLDAAHSASEDLTTGARTVTPTPGIALSRTTLALEEDPAAGGGTNANVGTYTIRLTADPTTASGDDSCSVTIEATSNNADVPIDADGTPQTERLIFTAADWNTPQTVTVTASGDADGADDAVTISHRRVGGTCVGGYFGQPTLPSVTVNVNDDETPALVIDADPSTPATADAGPLALDELASSGSNSESFTVKLAVPPTGNVTVNVYSDDTPVTVDNVNAMGILPLTFTTGNWSTAQTVTLTAAQDADGAHESVTITAEVPAADTTEYAGVSATLTATVNDDEAPAASISATNPAALTEGGLNGATVTVELANATYLSGVTTASFELVTDIAGVSVDSVSSVSSGDTSATLTLAFSGDFAGIETLAVRVLAAAHSGTADVTTATVNVTASAGVTVSKSSLVLEEAPGTTNANRGTYTIVLEAPFSGCSTVQVQTTSDNPDVTVFPTARTFSSTNPAQGWNRPQTFTVTAAQDTDGIPDTATISHSININCDADGYVTTLAIDDLEVTVNDDEVGVGITPTPAALAESTLHGATVAVALNGTTFAAGAAAAGAGVFELVTTPAIANLSIAQVSGLTDGGTTATLTLAFTGNFRALPTLAVRVPAARHTGSGALTSNAVTVTADAGVTVSEASLSLNEAPGSTNANVGTYTVVLDSPPTGCDAGVFVSLASNNADVTLSVSSINFTNNNWNTPRTVTTTAGQDDDGADDAATISHSINATLTTNCTTGYVASLTLPSVSVAVDDDETPGLVFDADPSTPSTDDAEPLNLDELSTSTTNADDYSVRLAAQPTQTVTVAVSSPDTGAVTVGTSSLTFTAMNWDTAQTVTLTAAQDLDGQDESVEIAHAASTATNSEYTGLSATFEAAVDDDETAAIVLSPTSLSVNEQNTATYTVALATLPTESVTVAITGAGSGISIDLTSLSFTATTWDTAQTVTATAVNDDNSVNEAVTLTHTATGADYDTLTADLEVTALDDDQPSLNVSTGSLTVPENDSRTYTIHLNTQPSANVTVTVNGAGSGVMVDTDAATAGGQNTLTFTDATWETAQTVTVSAAEDDNGVDETVALSHTASGGGYGSLMASARPGVSVTADDNDTPAVLLDANPTTPNVDEAGPLNLDELMSSGTNSASYTVRLRAQPTQTVTVAVSSEDTDAVTVGTSSLTFTTTNWNMPQTVTATAQQDLDGADESVDVAHTAGTATNSEYTGVTGDFEVAVDDDETPAITLSPTALNVNEANSAAYTVALATQPTGGVTVAVTGAGSGISIDVSSLTFTTGNWSTAQTVTASAAGDQDSTNEQVTLTHTASGADYDTLTADLEVTALDDDTPSLRVDPTALTVDEGTSGTYTVRLNTLPTATVTVTVGGAASGVTVDTSSQSGDQNTLTFTATSWETEQTVTVSAAADDNGVDEMVSLSHAAAGGDYGTITGAALPGVTVTADDDDAPAVLLDANPATATVDEAGPQALKELAIATDNSLNHTVRLATEPTADVTVAITSADTGAVTVGASALTFTANNWDTGQTVALTAAQDADGVNESVVVTYAASTASMSEYTNVSATITATVEDDEVPALVFDSDTSTPATVDAAPLNLEELAGSATNSDDYSVRLSSQPTQDVTVTITSPDTGAVTVGASTLTFTTANWRTAQTVTATAAQDLDGADESVDVSHAASTATNSEYTGITGAFEVAVDDDETPAITLSPTSLNVNEELSAAYTVALATQPKGGGVTVAVTGAGSGISANPTSLAFTSSNWATARTVTARAADDQNSVNEQVTLTHTATGADYGTLTADLEVTALDNDTPSLRVDPTALTVPEADSRAYAVRLNTQPSATVTVTVSGAGSGVTVDTDSASGDQNTLTFTANTWETNQTVTVSAAADDNGVDEMVSLSHAAAGGDYGTITGAALPGVSVTADDDDTPAVLLDADPTTDSVDEAGPLALQELASGSNSDTYTVRLATEPTEDVTVTVTSSDTGAVAVGDTDGDPNNGAQNTLTFTALNWDTRRTVTVAAAQDDDGVDEEAVVTNAAAAGMSEYGGLSAAVTVTVDDDETPGFAFDAVPSTPAVDDAGPLNLDELPSSGTNSASYTVRLATEPKQTVTVTVTSDDAGAVSVGDTDGDPNNGVQNTLTFTSANWSAPQAVALTAQQDLDGADEGVDIGHAAATSPASEYTGVSADFRAAVDDDETPGITLSPASLTVSEQDSRTYTVVLDTEPVGGGVTVSVTGAADGIAASPARLAFSASNWSTARTVTVRAADDQNSANEVVTLTHAASGGDYGGVSEDLEVTAQDNDTPSLRVRPTALTVREDGSAAYRIRLNTEPSAAVTVTVGGTTAEVTVDADRDAAGDQTSLTFTDANWRAERTVAVSAAPDDDATDEMVNLTHAAAGGDYTGLLLTARPGVSVTVDDDDEPAVLLDADPGTLNEDEPGPLALNELSGHPDNSKGYTVRLATEPTAQVEVTITSGDRAVSVDTGQTPLSRTLTFTTTNWAMPQTVTATAAEDPDASNERVEIAHAADGGDYGGVSARLFATTVDDDDPALVVDAAALTAAGVAEGGSAIYTVRLETEPAGVAVVSIAVAGGVSVDADGDQAGLQRSLRFDAANWNVARTVLVRGLEDDDAAAGTAALRHTSSGADYGRAQAVDVSFAVNDDDVPAVVIDQTAVAVNEGASTAYLVSLATAPVGGAVTVSLSSSDAAAATVSPAQLRFTASDWNRPRRVTVRGAPDGDSADGSAMVSHSVSGGDYGAVTASPVAVAVRDSEAAGVRVEPPRLTVREGGTGRYRVRLNTEPAGDVTVTATGGAELSVDSDETPQERALTFTTGNWGSERTVTVEAARDDGAEDGSLTVTHAVSGYAGVATAPALQVQVEDGDEPGFTFDPEGGLSLSEEPADPADAMGTYSVRLATQPSGAVAVEVASDDAGVEVDTDGTPRTLSLSFDASNWATGQSVSVRAVADADQVGETASLLHTAAGGGYGGVSGTLRVRVADDDRPPAPPPPPPPPPENRPPVVVGSLSDLDLDVGESTSVRLGGVFADDGPLSHWAESSDGSVASARVEGNSMLQVSGLSPGAATVTVWAADVEGQRAQLSFRVSVGRVLSFDPASASAPEGGMLRLRLSLSRPAGEALSVSWTALPDGDAATADADAADVSALSGTAEFAAGRTEAFIELEVRDDAEIEPAREVLRVELSPPPEGANWALGRSWALLWVEEGVCDRSPVVRDALRGSRECSAPTSSDLSGRGYLGLHRLDLPALRPKDFLGLSGLRVLHLHGNLLPELPAGLFEGLSSLERLRLDGNRLPSLPEGTFAGLGRLKSLRLDGNRLESLPANLLSGASNLERLDLGGNLLESLPPGLFAGAANLDELNLDGNPGAPFALVMRLIRTDAEPWEPGPAWVSARVEEGAPFAFSAALAAENAEPSAESTSVQAGATSGVPLSVTSSGPGAARLSLSDGPALPATLCGDVQDGRRPCFRGLSVQAGPSLLLFKPPPSPTGEPPTPALSADGDRASLALEDLFSPAESGDRLTYEAESNRPDLLSVRIVDGGLVLEANEDGNEGTAVVTVTATDPDGPSATLSLTVPVEYARVGAAPSWRLEWIRTLRDAEQ